MVPFERDFELVIGTQFGPYVYAFNTTKSRMVGTCTVVPSTNVFTLTSNGLVNSDQVRFTTTDTLPDPLVPNQYYYIINVAINTFKLALTSGGSAIDIEDVGAGTHTLIERGEPLDITGSLFYSWVKEDLDDPDSPVVLDLAPTILGDATNGLVQILVDWSTTFAFETSEGFHSLIRQDADGVRLAHTRGKFNIVKISTHPPILV